MLNGYYYLLLDGVVVIVVIIFCINIFNFSVLMVVGLLVKKVVECGLQLQLWVKVFLVSGLKVVLDYLVYVGLMFYFDQFGFNLVGYGCIICIGNFGLLFEFIEEVIKKGDLIVGVVFFGNCNFEGCIYLLVKINWLVLLLLVVVYVLVGNMNIDFICELLGQGKNGELVYLKDIWLSGEEIVCVVEQVFIEMFCKEYVEVFFGIEEWKVIKVEVLDIYDWQEDLIYICLLLFFDEMGVELLLVEDICGVWIFVMLGDLVIMDYILLVGSIKVDSLVGCYLQEYGVVWCDFNFYGFCCGNYEVMMCGIFVNICICNEMVSGVEGGMICYLLDFELMVIYDVVMLYKVEGILLVVIVGKEYGLGFSCDWVVKGLCLLGIWVVIVEFFECIYCFNLIGMGILLLEFLQGVICKMLWLIGEEWIDISNLQLFQSGVMVLVILICVDGLQEVIFCWCCIDMVIEFIYYCNDGILYYVICNML